MKKFTFFMLLLCMFSAAQADDTCPRAELSSVLISGESSGWQEGHCLLTGDSINNTQCINTNDTAVLSEHPELNQLKFYAAFKTAYWKNGLLQCYYNIPGLTPGYSLVIEKTSPRPEGKNWVNVSSGESVCVSNNFNQEDCRFGELPPPDGGGFVNAWKADLTAKAA